jgi:hypothetical protein
MTRILFFYLMIPALLNYTNVYRSPALNETPWRIEVDLEPRFAPGQSADIEVSIEERDPNLFKLIRRSPLSFEVKPLGAIAIPTYLALRVQPVGFEAVRFNTGKLKYSSIGGESFSRVKLSWPVTGSSAPYISQLMPGFVEHKVAFGLSITNPSAESFELDQIEISAEEGGGGCFSAKEVFRYKVNLLIQSSNVKATAQRVGEDFVQKISAELAYQCSRTIKMVVKLNGNVSDHSQRELQFIFDSAGAKNFSISDFYDWHFNVRLKKERSNIYLSGSYSTLNEKSTK